MNPLLFGIAMTAWTIFVFLLGALGGSTVAYRRAIRVLNDYDATRENAQ